MIIDGRNVRRVINQFVNDNYPGKNPVFTVRTISKISFGLPQREIEVRFDELDNDALEVWYDVAEYITDYWWPKRDTSHSKYKNGISVGYGFTH